MVIKGYMQPDWGETHGPVGKLTTFRYLTSLATGYGLAIDHLDVVTAFLNSHVDDSELYTEAPNGWDNDNGDCHCGGCGDCNCGEATATVAIFTAAMATTTAAAATAATATATAATASRLERSN